MRFCLHGPFGGPPFPCKPLQMYFFLCLPKLKFEVHCIVCGMPGGGIDGSDGRGLSEDVFLSIDRGAAMVVRSRMVIGIPHIAS